MVTYGGEQSLDRYLALSARGLPFNVAHAAGNFAIALAAGPGAGADDLALPDPARVQLAPGGSAAAGARRPGDRRQSAGDRAAAARARRRVGRALARARAERRTAASPRRPGQPSSPAMTGWAMLGLEAAGTNPLDVVRGGESAGRLPARRGRAGCARPATSSGRSSRSTGPGSSPRASPAADLVAELRRRRDRDGSVDGQVNLTAFYVLAMRAAGAEPGSLGALGGLAARGAERRRRLGHSARGAPSEPDSTGAALQALARGRGPGGSDRRRRAAGCARPSARGGGWALATERRRQLAVDRLGGPGPGRGRRRRRRGRRGARLPRPPAGRRRPLPLLGAQRPDAGLGHRPGAARRSSASRSRSRPPPGRPGGRRPARAAAGAATPAAAPRRAAGDPGSSRGARRGQRRCGVARRRAAAEARPAAAAVRRPTPPPARAPLRA